MILDKKSEINYMYEGISLIVPNCSIDK